MSEEEHPFSKIEDCAVEVSKYISEYNNGRLRRHTDKKYFMWYTLSHFNLRDKYDVVIDPDNGNSVSIMKSTKTGVETIYDSERDFIGEEEAIRLVCHIIADSKESK